VYYTLVGSKRLLPVVRPFYNGKNRMSSAKSQVFVKATAELSQEVAEKDLKAENKNMGEIINEFAGTHQCGRIRESDRKDNGDDKAKV
jgi:hypothetical protein